MNKTNRTVFQVTTRTPVVRGRALSVWVVEETDKFGQEGREVASSLDLMAAVNLAVAFNAAR